MAAEADGPRESVTLHSSWKSLVLSFFGALFVFGVGLGTTINSGGAAIAIIILVLGSVFLASVLFDSPVASTFTTDGVQRRPLLRRHFIPWDRVGQITRTRPVIAGALKGLTPGGMAAKVGRRRYLLVDQCEALREFQELVELLGDRYVTLGIDEMVQPPEAIDPTWTYRRKRWLPDG